MKLKSRVKEIDQKCKAGMILARGNPNREDFEEARVMIDTLLTVFVLGAIYALVNVINNALLNCFRRIAGYEFAKLQPPSDEDEG